jgi:ribosomal protein S18 acetylase RimI-like enzyme
MHIRAASIKDTKALNRLGQNVPEFSVNDGTVNFWPEPLLENAILSKDTLIFVAEEKREIIGFIIAAYNEGFKKSTIENIYVAPDSRNKGIGSMLLQRLIENLQQRGCKYIATLVPLDAHDAITLYQGAGFAKGGQFLWVDKALGNSFKQF